MPRRSRSAFRTSRRPSGPVLSPAWAPDDELLPKPQLVEEVRALRAEVMRLRDGWSERDDLVAQLNEALVELSNHEEELRAQNEELREVHRTLEAERRRYVELYEDAPVGYVSLDPDLRIDEMNVTAGRLMGRNRAELIGESIIGFIDPDDQNRMREHVRNVFTGHREQVDLTLGGASQTRLPVRFESVPESDPDGRVVMCRSAVTDVTEWKRAERELEHLAHHDPLTGVSNRVLLQDRLRHAIEAAKRDGSEVGLLYVDLDNFKLVNDTLGHGAGDDLLQQLARRMCAAVRKSDTVARFGGDEFVVLLEHFKKGEDVGDVADKVLKALRKPAVVNGRRVNATVSLGFSVYPRDGRTAQTLLRKADLAMYQAKQTGKDRSVPYERSMNRRLGRRLHVASRFQEALIGGELEMHFQPIVGLADRQVLLEEGLVRWARPPRDVLMPQVFLPVAEELGLMERLTGWGLGAIVAYLRGQAPRARAVRASLNLSASQLSSPSLPALFEQALAESGLSGSHLAIEITEHSIIHDIASAMHNIERLRALGVAVLLDDFGTGYSSLGYLKQLPIDFLKIDATFVRHLPEDRQDVAIVEAIVRLAHNLGVRVIAEGVETPAQLSCVEELGCDAVQGFLVGRPRPAPGER